MKCKKCSMDATVSLEVNGVTKYYCEHHDPRSMGLSQNFSTLKKILPLLSIFLLVASLTLVSGYFWGDSSVMSLMMYMMSYFFLIFGVFKIFNLQAFADAYQTYDLIAIRSRAYAVAYPFLELVLGLLYFFWIGGIWRDLFTAMIMTVGTIGVWKALNKGEEIQCACLGMVFSVPMTKVTLFENIFMSVMALWMVYSAVMFGMHM